jgi:hypothetical protein
MKPYIKKPEAVEAAQWAGDNYGDFHSMAVRPHVQDIPDAICRFCGRPNYEHALALVQGSWGSQVWAPVHPRDWVVRTPDAGYSVLGDKEFHDTFTTPGGNHHGNTDARVEGED